MDRHKLRAADDGRIRLCDRVGDRGERRRFGTVAFLLRFGIDKVTAIDFETNLADLARVIVDTRDGQVCIPRLRVARVGDSVVNALLQQRNAVVSPHNRLGGEFSACPHIQILVGNRLDIEVPRPQGEDHGSRATVAAAISTIAIITEPAATAATTAETIGTGLTYGFLFTIAAAAKTAESGIARVSAAAAAAAVVNRFAGDAAHDALAAIARALGAVRVLIALMARAAAATTGPAAGYAGRTGVAEAADAGTSG